MSALHNAGFRTDIQGLRAIAVLLVLVFHLWPGVAPGGYVGVDVFFVISGYLMTGMLVREAEQGGTISLARFYARRIRRLLPAACATLVVVGVAATFLLPIVRWDDTAAEIGASAFYVQNWWLAAESVDYLAVEQAASPVQHFWSLSVEEQFYILWPLLILVVLWLRRHVDWPLRRLLWAVLLPLTAASLAYSMQVTAAAPAPAYFSTGARFWELGLGGLLAVGPRRAAPRLLLWLGLGAITASALLYSTLTSFPGYAALLPTLGAAAVIHAGLPGGLLALPPLQYLGGISYSLYLWHWPLIVFYELQRGRAPGAADGLLILAGSIGLAALSKVFVEDPARTTAGLQRRPWRSYAMGAGALLACAAVAASLHLRVARSLDTEAWSARDYPGAAALAGAPVVPRPIRPTPLQASRERGAAQAHGDRPACIQDVQGTEVLACEYGPQDAPVTVALVGDSHAEHWVPAFEEVARTRGWRVTAYMKDSCLIADATVHSRGLGRPFSECDVWKEAVVRRLLATRPSLVVVSQASRHRVAATASPAQSRAPLAEALRRTWHRLADAGLAIAVIAHTPLQQERILECLSDADATIEGCSATREQALVPGPVTVAAQDNPEVAVIDMTDQFCPGQLCPAAIGNLLVYRDANHITASYARTMAPVLGERLAARLRQGPGARP